MNPTNSKRDEDQNKFSGRRWADIFSDDDSSFSFAMSSSKTQGLKTNESSLGESCRKMANEEGYSWNSIQKQTSSLSTQSMSSSHYVSLQHRTKFPLGFTSLMHLINERRAAETAAAARVDRASSEPKTSEQNEKQATTTIVAPLNSENQLESNQKYESIQTCTSHPQQVYNKHTLLVIGVKILKKKNRINLRLLPQIANNNDSDRNKLPRKWNLTKSLYTTRDYNEDYYFNRGDYSFRSIYRLKKTNFNDISDMMSSKNFDINKENTLLPPVKEEEETPENKNAEPATSSEALINPNDVKSNQITESAAGTSVEDELNESTRKHVPTVINPQENIKYNKNNKMCNVKQTDDGVIIQRDHPDSISERPTTTSALTHNQVISRDSKKKMSSSLSSGTTHAPQTKRVLSRKKISNKALLTTAAAAATKDSNDQRPMPVCNNLISYRKRQIALVKAKPDYKEYVISKSSKASTSDKEPRTPNAESPCSTSEFNRKLRSWQNEIRLKKFLAG